MLRTDIIQHLINKNNYKSYLEIGMDNPHVNFLKIKCDKKVSVDPFEETSRFCTHWDSRNKEEYLKHLTYRLTSDDFFKQNTEKFDIIFIDGLHLDHQVMKDIENSLRFLNDNGRIVVHDCLPLTEQMQTEINPSGAWTGSVWKAVARYIETYSGLDIKVIDSDYGVGVIKKTKTVPAKIKESDTVYNWKYFVENRNKILNVISVQDFLNNE